MSRSWVRSRPTTSRADPERDRGQTEPLAALAAVLAVGIAVVLYADALAVASPQPSDSGVANATLDPVRDELSDGPVADPERISEAAEIGPDGHQVNVTLATTDRTWTAGPVPPSEAEDAYRPTSVRVAPGRIEPGQLRVVVWT